MDLKEVILNRAEAVFNEVVNIRRHLHAYPELSFKEYKTSEFVQHKLKEYGISFQAGYVETGVIGWIAGRNPDKKLVALRADMDALPIAEETDAIYASKNPGVMHACGHDVHTSSLLGAAKILNEMKDHFEGTVMLVFQPAEEKLPGGARLMLDAGIFSKRKPDVMIAQHVLPELECGYAGFKPGTYMAASDEIYVTLKGKGGHGAIPHEVTDTVLIASHLVVALQQIVSRNANAVVPSVLSFGKVIANGATNVIPDKVILEGTFRTTDEVWRVEAHQKMKEMATLLAKSMGATCEFEVRKGYPTLVNHVAYTRAASDWASEFLGGKVEEMEQRMTSEDFACFAQEVPGVYYRLGIRPLGEKIHHLHTAKFDIDEGALKTGVGLMTWLALKFLEAPKI
jgi:amidohydrolase